MNSLDKDLENVEYLINCLDSQAQGMLVIDFDLLNYSVTRRSPHNRYNTLLR